MRKEWGQRVKEKMDSGDLLEPENVVSPARMLGPVKELRLVNGFECMCCAYVCGTLGTAQIHRRTHGWRVGKETTWKPQHMQVFYHNILLTYRHSVRDGLITGCTGTEQRYRV
jgi:hypothetical protein